MRQPHFRDIAQYYLLDAFGCHAAITGEPALAAQLIGAAETVRSAAGARVIPTLVPLLAQAEAQASVSLGQSRFQAEVARGNGMTRSAVVALALGETRQVGSTPA